MPDFAYPLPVFRFQVDFFQHRLSDTAQGDQKYLCSGAFAECTGLEATMEPKVIKEGGRNYGTHQRVGQVTFATVILKRGMTKNRDLWHWFEMATLQGKYTYRLTAEITMRNIENNDVLKWRLERALPTKFKAADLNAKGTDVGIEELHLAHEGLSLIGIADEEGT